MQPFQPDQIPPPDPTTLPREGNPHYIAASAADIDAMLAAVGVPDLAGLYAHIPADCRFAEPPGLPDELSYAALLDRLAATAAANHLPPSFIGDGLHAYTVHPIVGHVSAIRKLTTAYTPYQPERSQGTLHCHWVYQCLLAQLTGFEAINSSLYDRASAIFEAICSALRLARGGASTALIAAGLYPGDLEVVRTLAADTAIRLDFFPLDPATGRTDFAALAARIAAHGADLAAIVYPQVNNLGLLEDVDRLTDLAAAAAARSIAVIDPFLLAAGGLKAPVHYGRAGADMIVGEAQHLAIGPNFGGPGLGLFGTRYHAGDRTSVRQTPGRYVGRARDAAGRACLVMVLSTREQHIRKDKATSNICSNQAFLATLAGAAILARGESGMAAAIAAGRAAATAAYSRLGAIPGLQPAFPGAPFFNEIVLATDEPCAALIEAGRLAGLHIGVDVSDRIGGGRNLLKLTCTDQPADLDALVAFFAGHKAADGTAAVPPHTADGTAAVPPGKSAQVPPIPGTLLRAQPPGLPEFPLAEVRDYYTRLGELNASPDDGCYPLGSCTMKYNPHVNDWAAGLPGFTMAHPQAPVADVQGCLEVLHAIEQWFIRITGLAAVTTQPVAGAQGELVGLKLFQAYHRDRGEAQRDVILIPASAHGTNFATAAMAGYASRSVDGRTAGIVLLASAPDGTIAMDDLRAKIAGHGPHLAGIMITNPNTCGIFETNFRAIADAVHAAGGLVYMDGANMNAIAGWCDLGAMGVDAVHNNLHKTWTIPHGGGGPGDAIVAVSERLAPYLPGWRIERVDGLLRPVRAPQSIGSFHRHWGNFAHKVRAWAYLLRLGRAGVPRVTALAVLSARYCFARLRPHYPALPADADATPRMHEFILTLGANDFTRIEQAGIPRALIIGRVGKLFLDYGFHAPTVAWPETYGLMIEPTESYTKAELDRFCEAVAAIAALIRAHPEVLLTAPHFTPIDRIDEVAANRQPQLSEELAALPPIHPNRLDPAELAQLPIAAISERIRAAHRAAIANPGAA
jgi:glycine dehydrogenase